MNCVISGIGTVTSVGRDTQGIWEKATKGEIGIRPVQQWDAKGCNTDRFGEIELTNDALQSLLPSTLYSQQILPYERGELLFVKAFEEAINDAGFNREALCEKRVGIFIGTSLSGFTTLEREYTEYLKKGTPPSIQSFLVFPINTVADRLAYEYQLKGPRFIFSTACSASLHSVVWARTFLEAGEIDVAVLGGTDPLSLISMAGFSSLQCLAKTSASPFSTTDAGISVGEGAGVLIMEKEEDFAKRSSRQYYGIISGCAGTSDAYHPTASDPTGLTIKECITQALSGIDEINTKKVYIMAHGTGTQHNDVVETRAIRMIPNVPKLKVSSLKGTFGHTLGASGTIELALLCKSLNEEKCLPTANFSLERPGCNLDYVKNKSISYPFDVGVKNAFAFGGNNLTVSIVKDKSIIKEREKPEEEDIVITGIGMLTGFGSLSPEEMVAKVSQGENCIKKIHPIQGFRRKKTIRKAAIIETETLKQICLKKRIKNYRKMDRISMVAVVTSGDALRDSGLKISSKNNLRVGLISGTSTGPLESITNFYTDVINKGTEFANASLFPNTVINAHAGYINMEFNIKGYTTVVSQGNISDLTVMDLAVKAINSGQCDAVLVGATAEYSSEYHRALIDLGSISDEYRIYDDRTNGYILGEGSVFFVLERKSSALQRGARIYSTIKKVYLSGDPVLPSTPRYEYNPLVNLFEKHFAEQKREPSLIYGNGIALKPLNVLEAKAVEGCFPEVPLLTYTEQFGHIPGVNSFVNLAMHIMTKGKYYPYLQNTSKPIAPNIRVSSAEIKKDGEVIFTSVVEGGTSGYIQLGSGQSDPVD